MIGDGGGRWDVDEEVEGRDRLSRELVGEVGTVEEKMCPRCSTVGVKRPLARSVVGVKTSGREGDKGLADGRMMPEGSEEALKESGDDVSL
jgi:hypothetical protein